MLAWIAIALVLLVASGLLLADYLTPAATGRHASMLPTRPAQTALDRELAPLLARHPGQTGVLLLPDGVEAFAARAMSARQAGRSLDLQYYIWHDDLAGRLLAREAWLAAQRGVRVRMLLDDINASGKDAQLLALDAHPNIEVRLYNPFRNRSGPRRMLEMLQRVFSLNHRMHNKAWIADGRVAVVGGRNIGEEYFNASTQSNFRDLDALLFGPAVAQAGAIFDTFWNSDAVVPIAALGNRDPADLQALLARSDTELDSVAARRYLARVATRPSVQDYQGAALAPHWSNGVEVVSDPPRKRDGDDRAGWLVTQLAERMGEARREALLVSPYFVPGEPFAARLEAAARAGLRVGIVTNSLAANDVIPVHSGYRRYRLPLLQAGVCLHELRAQPGGSDSGGLGSTGASLHTKAFVIDGAHGFIGSFNLDPRSAYLNTEMGLLFRDSGIAADLRAEYLRLAAPGPSYRVLLDAHGRVRWLDRTAQPPRLLADEPDADWLRRAKATVFGWLPIESQL